jgi:hypothetical protein
MVFLHFLSVFRMDFIVWIVYYVITSLHIPV